MAERLDERTEGVGHVVLVVDDQDVRLAVRGRRLGGGPRPRDRGQRHREPGAAGRRVLGPDAAPVSLDDPEGDR